MTVKEILSDVELQLYQGDVSDDAVLSWAQLRSWLTQHANELVVAELNNKITSGDFIPPMYQVRESCKVLELEEAECGGDCQDRVKITLTNPVLPLNGDGGVVYLETDDGDQIKKAGSINHLTMLKHMRFAKPTYDNPMYTRQNGETIYIDGYTGSDLEIDAVNVIYVARKNYTSDSDTVLISDTLLPALIESLVQRGKLMLYGTQADQANDGVDPKAQVYHTAISNPEKE